MRNSNSESRVSSPEKTGFSPMALAVPMFTLRKNLFTSEVYQNSSFGSHTVKIIFFVGFYNVHVIQLLLYNVCLRKS